MSRLEHRRFVPDIGSWSHSQAADLPRGRIREIIAVQVWRRQDRVLVWPDQNLLEDRVSYSIFYQYFVFPFAASVRSPDCRESFLDLVDCRGALLFGHLIESGLDQPSVCLIADLWILLTIIEDPGLSFGDDLISEFLFRQLIAPVPECALGELHYVAFVHQGNRWMAEVERVLDG